MARRQGLPGGLRTNASGGLSRARVDGVLHEVHEPLKLSARKRHAIEVVIDRLVVRPNLDERLTESLQTALKHSGGRVIITDVDDGDWHDQAYNTVLECPRCGIEFDDLEPNQFSFNNPHGACPRCTGYGKIWELDPAQIVPDSNLSLAQILERLREVIPEQAYADLLTEFGRRGDAKTPLSQLSQDAASALIDGDNGLLPALRELWTKAAEDEDEAMDAALASLAGFVPCPECGGARLNAAARAVRFEGQSLPDVTALPVSGALAFFQSIETGGPENDGA